MRRGFLLTALLASSTCGCASSDNACGCAGCQPSKSLCPKYIPLKDDLKTKMTAIKCADDSLENLKDCGKLSKDYQDGFREAYIDQAFGRPLTVPPVPPRHYWTVYHRSCAGHEEVAQWFEGYRAGLEIGATSGVRDFHRVQTSWNGQSPAETEWHGSVGAGNPSTIEGSAWGAVPMSDARSTPGTRSEVSPTSSTLAPLASYRANALAIPVHGGVADSSPGGASASGWSPPAAAPVNAPTWGPMPSGR